ncbi:MAG: Hsp20/alpha crystallin family protein [Chromatocurvus sp.]
MSLIPRNSLFDIESLLDAWPQLSGNASMSASAFSPRVDITEKKGHYELTAELPGVSKQDIEVTLDNGMLTISAESRSEDKEEKDGRVIRQERRYGKYTRSFNLGNDIKEKDIKAEFNDGVLKLSVPKVEQKAPVSHRIDVN